MTISAWAKIKSLQGNLTLCVLFFKANWLGDQIKKKQNLTKSDKL